MVSSQSCRSGMLPNTSSFPSPPNFLVQEHLIAMVVVPFSLSLLVLCPNLPSPRHTSPPVWTLSVNLEVFFCAKPVWRIHKLPALNCQFPTHSSSEIQLQKQETPLSLRILHYTEPLGNSAVKFQQAQEFANCSFSKVQNLGQTQSDFLRDRKSPSLGTRERKNTS